MHEEEQLEANLQDPPKAYPLRFEVMVKLSVDEFSDDKLARRYTELEDKGTWDEVCKMCRMPRMLHRGEECVKFDIWRILDERDEFIKRMKPIMRYIKEREERML